MSSVYALQQDLLEIYQQSNVRGLKQSCKWASEMLCSLRNQTTVESECLKSLPQSLNHTFENPPLDTHLTSTTHLYSNCDYLLAKSVFDLGEYQRAAHLTRNHQTRELMFLHYYSQYLAYEKERLDRMVEPSSVSSPASEKAFYQLRESLDNLFEKSETARDDAYMRYLYGVVLVKLNLPREAAKELLKSVRMDALCWCSWQQLSQIIMDEGQMKQIVPPHQWLSFFYLAATYAELLLYEQASKLYEDLLLTFSESNYINCQLGVINYHRRETERAVNHFSIVRTSDPYRLESIDIYSNLLYVKENQGEISSLARLTNRIDPFRVETCLCIANFYSIRGQHAKAIIYFSRALQLNPNHLSAWTLMGHEYVELKNTPAAIQAYRSAIRCQKRDFRAWYGLGQTYEILKMPAYSVYYYSKANYLKPNDTRLIMAIGHNYEKLGRYEEAANCFIKAGFSARIPLARLYEKLNDKHKAAAVYNEYVANFEEKQEEYNLKIGDLTMAYRFLAQYFLNCEKYPQAQLAAQMCMYFPETREEAKDILSQLQHATSSPPPEPAAASEPE